MAKKAKQLGPWTYKAPPPHCGIRWKIYSEHRKDDGSPYAPLCEVDTEEYARLIAACPDLLEALAELVRLKDARPPDYETQKPKAWERARAALTKATAASP